MYSEIDQSSTSPAFYNTAFQGEVNNNFNGHVNCGSLIDVYNNGSSTGQQANIGSSCIVRINIGSTANYGLTLNVDSNSNASNITQTNYGIIINNSFNDGALNNYGISSLTYNNNASRNTQQCNRGGIFEVFGNDSSGTNIGLDGEATNNYVSFNIGVSGSASGSTNFVVDQGNGNGAINGNIGVYGYGGPYNTTNSQFAPCQTCPVNVAGFFEGHVVIEGDLYSPSDLKLKNNIKIIDSSLYKLSLLEPKSYLFNTEANPDMTLPNKLHFGLLVQDVEKVFPDLVENLVNPPKIDRTGKIAHRAEQFMGINYQGFIPIIIQGMKELKMNCDSIELQNAKLKKGMELSNDSVKSQNNDFKKNIDALKQENNRQSIHIDSLLNVISSIETKVNSLSTLIYNCCNNNKNELKGEKDINNTDINSIKKIVPDNSGRLSKTELYQNAPNPFKTITTFSYTLGTTGFVELEITDQYGQLIENLVNANQETGNYSIDWDSFKVSPGLYYYSLKVNGLLFVRKAVKVN